jgi:PAS domain S-box-containing protein
LRGALFDGKEQTRERQGREVIMLNATSEHLQQGGHQWLKSSAISRVILRTSSELAEIRSNEIDRVIQRAIAATAEIEHAEDAGWFSLSESGKLLDNLASIRNPTDLCPGFNNQFHRMQWCLSQLRTGRAVVVDEAHDLPPEAINDQRFLSGEGIQSLVIVPYRSSPSAMTVFILSSTSYGVEWSEDIIEYGTLLGSIFSSAYQRRLAQDDSQASVKHFTRLLDASDSAMALLDNKGHFLSTNKSFCDILGYSDDEILKLKFDDLTRSINESDKASAKCPSRHKGTAPRSPLGLIRKDKSVIAARVTIGVIDRQLSEEALSLVAIEDLTEQINREQELSRRQKEVAALASQLIRSQEDERKHLSRELHDDIGQRLSLAASEVALLASENEDVTRIPVGRLAVLRDELDSLCSDIHNMSHSLHSYKLQHLGLKSALKDLCCRLSHSDCRVDLRAEEFDEPASNDVSLCLYRVAQESLNNALKHAHASLVTLTLTKLQDTFYMTIRDSGIGFDPGAVSQGLGLISMSERVKLVNGQLRLHSVPGRGTEIWIAVPDCKLN